MPKHGSVSLLISPLSNALSGIAFLLSYCCSLGQHPASSVLVRVRARVLLVVSSALTFLCLLCLADCMIF